MSSNATTSWILKLIDKVSSPLSGIDGKVNNTYKNVTKLGGVFDKVSAIDLHAVQNGFQELDNLMNRATQPAIGFEAQMKEVEAITGVTGEKLQGLGDSARKAAKDFGGDPIAQLGAYKTVLSRLGPELADKPKALELMGRNIQTLSKTMEGDAVGATDAITTSMLQYQVNLNDTNSVIEESTRMMNVMAAGAKFGAAEVPHISKSLEQSGVQANIGRCGQNSC